jgi:osmotically inducible lipoprotein OsmB
MRKFLGVTAIVLTMSGLAACNTPGERAAGGAVLGGAAGAAIGGLATGRAGGAIAGGIIGAAGGAIVGAATAPCPEGYVVVRNRYGEEACARRRYYY